MIMRWISDVPSKMVEILEADKTCETDGMLGSGAGGIHAAARPLHQRD
jgi:hypothetical protein